MKHSDLEVYKRSMELVRKTYAITRTFPSEERYALGNQMNKAVISIPSNIAEGAGRDATKEFIRFLNIASGSLNELETQLVLTQDLGYANTSEIVNNDLKLIRTMLFRLKSALKRKLK